MSDLPLQGIRILSFEQFGAGPFATLNLADMGAEVIKIEDPSTGGEVSRTVPPFQRDGDSLYFQSWNRNKRSLALDLRKPGAREVLHDLVRVSHVVFNNLRGDQPARLGLNYEALATVNPRIVCCSLSGYGSRTAKAAQPGYDYLMQASAGYMGITGDPSGPPSACGVSFIDHAAGFAAALAMVSALLAVQSGAPGRDVEVSLYDTALSMLTYLAAWNLNGGFEPQRWPGSAHQTLTPVQTFRTADGHITIFCGKEKFWRALCESLGDAELADRYPTFAARLASRNEVVEAVQEHFLRRRTDEWIECLGASVPCAPVRTVGEALAMASGESPGSVIEFQHPAWGALRAVNTPARFSGQARSSHDAAPALGADTDEILSGYLGYGSNHIAALRGNRVV